MQARHTQTGQIKPAGHASSGLFGAISPALVDTVHMIVHLDAVLTTEHQHNSLHLSLHDVQDTKSLLLVIASLHTCMTVDISI